MTKDRPSLEWVDATVASRIKIKKEIPGLFRSGEAENSFMWLYEKTTLFQKVFGRYFKEFQTPVKKVKGVFRDVCRPLNVSGKVVPDNHLIARVSFICGLESVDS
jgi:hypothetical protein